MPKIVRCHNCISLVYDGAEVCHHCGEKLRVRRKRIFSKGAGLFILLSVVLFTIGDAVYLAKERSKTLRFDRHHIKRFIDGQLNGGDSRRDWFRCKDDTVVVPVLRDEFHRVVGENPKILHRDSTLIDRKAEIVHWDGWTREIPARKYIHYIDWRGDNRGSYHSLPMTVEITGEPYSLRIIKVTWDGKDEELLREDGG